MPGDGPPIGALWPEPDRVEDAVRKVNSGWDDRLTRLSQHDLVRVVDRGEQSFRSTQVLRADADGPDRWVAIVHIDEHDRPLPLVKPLRHCTLGRVVAEPQRGLLVAELLFDRVLRQGECIVIEHELANSAPHPLATNYERKFRMPVREYVLEVAFDDGLPTWCEQFETGTSRTITPRSSLVGVALDCGPGVFGFHWKWS